MHGDKYYQYIISCDEDERLSLGIDIKYVHQLQNLYFVLTGQELEQTMKTAYYKYSYGKWILVGYVTEEIKP
jgi:hypothetical protein